MVHDDIPSVGTTALAFHVAVGSRDETPAQWGMAHLLEHLVFKGAGELDHRAIARQMDRLGSDINAFTTRDYTCFYAKVLDSEAVTAYELLRDLVTSPWLRAEDLAREKNVVLEEMKESLDDPDEVLDTLITEALYRDESYTHDILGTTASLAAADAAHLKAFFAAFYQPQNMVFSVSGGARDALLAAAEADFGHGPGVPSQLPMRRLRPQVQFQKRRLWADWEQVKLALAIPAPGRYDAEYGASLVLASLLGGQNTSRLWQRLREQEGLVYGVSTQYAPESDFGDMMTYLGLGPDHLTRALQAVDDEVAQLALVGPEAEELAHTRMYLNTVLVMNQETPDARVMRMGRYGLDGRRPPLLMDIGEQLAAVSAQAVRRQAEAWRDTRRMAAAAAGPMDDDMWAALSGSLGGE